MDPALARAGVGLPRAFPFSKGSVLAKIEVVWMHLEVGICDATSQPGKYQQSARVVTFPAIFILPRSFPASAWTEA